MLYIYICIRYMTYTYICHTCFYVLTYVYMDMITRACIDFHGKSIKPRCKRHVFSPRMEPRVTDLPSSFAKLQGESWYDRVWYRMTWWTFHLIFLFFHGFYTDEPLSARHRYSTRRQSFHDGTLTASRGHPAMSCHANLVKETSDS